MHVTEKLMQLSLLFKFSDFCQFKQNKYYFWLLKNLLVASDNKCLMLKHILRIWWCYLSQTHMPHHAESVKSTNPRKKITNKSTHNFHSK